MTTKTPFIVHCGKCKHEWPAFYTPMNFDKAVDIMESAHCPMCAADPIEIYCGPASVDAINTSSERGKNNGET